MDDIPCDTWTEIPDEELAKIGKTQWVYMPSNYPGPVAMDGYIKDVTHYEEIQDG